MENILLWKANVIKDHLYCEVLIVNGLSQQVKLYMYQPLELEGAKLLLYKEAV